ncbi:MAG TPA: hypothetical protein VLW54_06695 [Candidatus Acidoferrales bacterium]|nr:hypothetical protein [Candidatus Acidoferrales bacterium]
MPPAKSATDVISPAFERVKRQMLTPFRMATWSRLALIAVLTGEVGGGGWSSVANSNLTSGGQPGNKLASPPFPWMEEGMKYLPYLLVGLVALVCLGIVMLYVQSVFRFVLFDAVLRTRYGIREGWRRWKEAGSSFFLWQLTLGLLSLAVTAVILGLPAYWVWRTKLYEHAEENIGLLIGVGLIVFAIWIGVFLAGALVELGARDFVVPVMAMERVRVMEGWRRVLPMLGAEKGKFVFYVVMKIVLSIGVGILLGFAAAAVFIAALIPLGIVGAAVFVAAAAGGLGWNAYTIAATGVAGMLVVLGLFYLMGFAYAPGMVFFQAYALEFLGARYARLGAELAPPAPPRAPPTAGGALPSPAAP